MLFYLHSLVDHYYGILTGLYKTGPRQLQVTGNSVGSYRSPWCKYYLPALCYSDNNAIVEDVNF